MRTYRTDLTAEFVRSILDYDAATGIFIWKQRADKKRWWRASHLGRKAGHLCKTHGYVSIKINGFKYPAHRLAYLYVNGVWPDEQIDHRNMNRADNRISEIRPATAAQNAGNKKTRPDTLVKLKGVSKHKDIFRAKIGLHGKVHHLGLFNCPAAAHFAYVVEADKQFGEFARFS